MKSNNTNQQLPPLPPSNKKSSTTVGVIVILFGLFLLMRNLNIGMILPYWLFGWQMILIIIGLVIGVNSKFQKKSSVVLIGIGSFFLLREWMDNSAMKILIPIMAIAVGVYIIKKNRKQEEVPLPPPIPPTHPTDEFDWDRRVTDMPQPPTVDNLETSNGESSTHTSSFAQDSINPEQNFEQFYRAENILKVETLFGTVKKNILSKNFLGGNITNVFGTTVINLLQADLKQPIVIDTFQLFGSTKIIVPPHWTVTHDVSSILGDNDDRRVIINQNIDEQRRLYITGTSIFGTLTIKNA